MIKRLLIIAILLPLAACGDGLPSAMPASEGDHIFDGDSITHLCANYTDGLNRAVPGNTSADLLERVERFADVDAPAKYYILIGVNDIIKGIDNGYASRLNAILGLLQGEVIVTSILPTRLENINEKALQLNKEAKVLAEHWGYTYRDVYDQFKDSDGLLRTEYNLDNLHLNDEGCKALFEGI